ncbi:hypothetical protein [Klebsiella variicola]|uniref:hypothetical protein n=1 Tax=Klebsiella variicola TaxID=244366 RepID=UPI002364F999|nr:hypothetical protein [Klebsiella variicola]HCC2356979.1 hypothetical protein [Klebsiella variicola]HDK6322388.1 hypothetical protein [Klebsiella variicola]HDS5362534.1 hypothetical protein [Klebsiella variicola]
MRDLAMGGVFFPGLLVVGLVALLATLLQPLIFSIRGLGRLPCRPLWGLSLYIALFFLLMQEVNTLGFAV